MIAWLLLQAADAEGVEFFEKKIRPVLVEQCYSCHSAGAKSVKGGLKLDSRHDLLKGGDSGPALVAGDPDKSLLIKALRRVNPDLAMPPKKTLPKEVVADFEAWVKRGAPDPRTGGPIDPVADQAKKHWAFQPVSSPAVPATRTAGWAKTEVDAFILAALEAKNLKPQPEADRRTLIRRATFDLLGLPPTPEEVEAFEKDKDPQAYEKVIDRLLASPRYGERWARHWLDVARYSDTKGYVFQEERRYPFAYTYRDWAIEAFNADLPYDQFILQQLAADRLPLGEDKRPLAAMGFLTVGRRFLNNIADITDDRIDVVTRGFMALTVGCARCHDHKYDPIPTKDYYSLYGVFVSSNEPKDLPVLTSYAKDAKAVEYEKILEKLKGDVEAFKKTRLEEKLKGLRSAKSIADHLMAAREWTGGDDDKALRDFAQKRDLSSGGIQRWRERLKKKDAIFKLWLALDEKDLAKSVSLDGVHPKIAEAFKTPPASLREAADRYGAVLAAGEKDEALKKVLFGPDAPCDVPLADLEKLYNRKDRDEHRAKEKKIEEHKASHPGAPAHAMVMVDNPKPTTPRVFIRGNPANPGPEVPRRFLSCVAGENAPPFVDGSGRLELAKAIASPGNPLTARVMVNRLWTLHFGQGLVRTPSDFGLRSDPPSHPDLLDFLARRFSGELKWSLKGLHRLLTTSAVYRQRADGDPAYVAVDPDNKLLWKMNRRRLEFEALRDSLLAVAGRLDTTLGGRPEPLVTNPTVKQKMNAETITNEGGGDASQDVYSRRRAIYLFVDRQNLPQTMRFFDFASPDQHSPQRFVTTVPQQALFLMNNPFVLEQSRHLAARAGEGDVASKIHALHRILFGRAATADELAGGRRFLELMEGRGGPVVSAWRYGYGQVDEAGKTVSFTALPHFTGSAWQGGAALPDAKLGWLTMTAEGGHPGGPAQGALIRRWTSPRDAVVSIEGVLTHKAAEGDGVHARIVSSRHGALASWTAHNTEAETKMTRVEVSKGDTLDFVVDCRKDEGWDSFAWAPVIRTVETPAATGAAVPQEWRASEQFGGAPGKSKPGPSALERYAHVLLQTNEFLFID